jgi:hypothetical protein
VRDELVANAETPQLLIFLLKEKRVKEKHEAIESITYTLWKMTETSTGIQSCIDAGAPLILTELASEKAVKSYHGLYHLQDK